MMRGKQWARMLVPVLALVLTTVSLGASVAAQTPTAATTVLTGETPELGEFLTDTNGMTLYIFKKDTPGVSNCYDKCEANWPVFRAEEPLTLPDGVDGELTLIDRTDGTKQVAFNGAPLYYFSGDKAAGDVTGQEVGDVWYVASTAPAGATPGASPAASPAA